MMRLECIPRGVVALGFVSLFMDASSEAIHSLLPIFLVGTLGTSALAFGVIEGFAEAAAAITKLFSGSASDWLGKRKPLLLAGYGLAALTKPAFALAGTVFALYNLVTGCTLLRASVLADAPWSMTGPEAAF